MVGNTDVCTGSAATAKSTNGKTNIKIGIFTGGTNRAAERKAAIAATTADRLRQNTIGILAGDHGYRLKDRTELCNLLLLDRGRTCADIAGIVDSDCASFAASSAEPAH